MEGDAGLFLFVAGAVQGTAATALAVATGAVETVQHDGYGCGYNK